MLKRTLLFTSPVILSLKNEQLVVCYKDTPHLKVQNCTQNVFVRLHPLKV